MISEEFKSEKNEIIIRRETGLTQHPVGNSSALTEIINRSLVHIQTSKTLEEVQRTRVNELTVARFAGDEQEFEIARGVKIVMCWIPPGEFLMGSPETEEDRLSDETEHRVRITQGFWLAKTQTTQAQWQAVMGNNPSVVQGEDLPVSDISWNEIFGNKHGIGGFLEELNKHASAGAHFYLPTEAQWEYACRAGTQDPYAGDLDVMGWYSGNSCFRRYPVGKKEPNAWGLHDMHGNVFEWCSDWYGAYDLSAVTDPAGPTEGLVRVVRGGSWDDDAANLRSAARFHDCPDDGYYDFTGFRLAFSQELTNQRRVK